MTTTTQQLTTCFEILVSRPCAALRSNGGHGNKFAINAARQDAKQEAWARTIYALQSKAVADATVFISYTEVLGPREHAMDDDNLIAAMKSTRDGIALALGINDKHMRVRPCGTVERGDVGGVKCRVWWEVME